MSDNRFLEKFEHKTDSELEHILSNKKTYTEEARNAAIILLEKRSVKPSELEKAQKEVDIRKDKKIVGVNKTIGLILHSQKSIGISTFFGGLSCPEIAIHKTCIKWKNNYFQKEQINKIDMTND